MVRCCWSLGEEGGGGRRANHKGTNKCKHQQQAYNGHHKNAPCRHELISLKVSHAGVEILPSSSLRAIERIWLGLAQHQKDKVKNDRHMDHIHIHAQLAQPSSKGCAKRLGSQAHPSILRQRHDDIQLGHRHDGLHPRRTAHARRASEANPQKCVKSTDYQGKCEQAQALPRG